MSWRHVLHRDLTSVFRSRIGASVLTFTLLFMVVPMWYLSPPDSAASFLSVLTVLTVLLMLALAVLGKPRRVTQTAAVFTGFFLLVSLVSAHDSSLSGGRINGLIVFLGAVLSFMVPLLSLLGSYGALVGERSSGSIRFLLGLPNSRPDAYVGKFLSRSGVVVLAVLFGFGLLGLVVLAVLGLDPFARLIGVGILTVPYVMVFVGIGLTASAIGDTGTHSIAVAIGLFALFRAGWPALQWLVLRLMGVESAQYPAVYYWVGRVNPINAYVKATTLLTVPRENGIGQIFVTSSQGHVAPVATSGGFALVVLFSWAFIAPAVGYWYFRDRDVL